MFYFSYLSSFNYGGLNLAVFWQFRHIYTRHYYYPSQLNKLRSGFGTFNVDELFQFERLLSFQTIGERRESE